MLRFIDSFEHYSTAQLARKWTTVNGTSSYITVESTGGRDNGYCLRIKESASGSIFQKYVQITLDSQATWIVGFRFKVSHLMYGHQAPFIRFYDGTTLHLGLDLLPNGSFQFYRSSTLLATSTERIVSARDYFLEFKVTIHDTTGLAKLNVDGVNWINFSGDTRNGANASANNIRFAGYHYILDPSTNAYTYFSDLYIADTQTGNVTDMLGDCRVDALFFTEDGYSSQLTPSAGSNYQNVDDNPADDDTTYNESSTAGHIDTYQTTTLGFTPNTIYGSQYVLTARKDDSGSRSFKRTIHDNASSPGVNYQGSATALTTSYTMYKEIIEDDPATSTNWTQGSLESTTEWGLEVV